MRGRLSVLSATFLLLAVSGLASASGDAGEAGSWKSFGAPFTLSDSRPLADVLADPAAWVGKSVRVRAHVTDVCQMKGCWMVLSEGKQTVRVTFKDYGFFVDKHGTGALAEAEGTLVEKPLDPKTEAHYAAESKTAAAAQQAHEGKTYEFVATSVRMQIGG